MVMLFLILALETTITKLGHKEAFAKISLSLWR